MIMSVIMLKAFPLALTCVWWQRGVKSCLVAGGRGGTHVWWQRGGNSCLMAEQGNYVWWQRGVMSGSRVG